MPFPPRRLLALLLASLCAASSGLQAAAPEAETTVLRMGRAFSLNGPPGTAAELPPMHRPATSPIFLFADEISGRTDVHTEAEGEVELRQYGRLLYADRAIHRVLEDELEALGNVRLLQSGMAVSADYLRLGLSTQLGYADRTTYTFYRRLPNTFYEIEDGHAYVEFRQRRRSMQGSSGAPLLLNVPPGYGLPTEAPPQRWSESSGEAQRIDFEGENHYRLSEATYSTCKPEQRDWYLTASNIRLDQDESLATLEDMAVWFQDTPIFYSPVGWFPLGDHRRSGLLNPLIKQSSRTGFDVTQPIYWNIAPNYDATFYPRYMSDRGTQLGVEGRYLGEALSGELRGEYLPEDRWSGDSRHAFSFEHRQRFSPVLSGLFEVNRVSDDHYWADLGGSLVMHSRVQLPRQARLNYTPVPWANAYLQVLQYQTLSDVLRPHFIEPRLSLSLRPVLDEALDLNVHAQFTRFTHHDGQTRDQGDRLVLYPQLALPLLQEALWIIPRVGLHMTGYQLDRAAINAGQPTQLSRVLPTFSLDSTLFLERRGSFDGVPYIQTLEPRLFYVNIPYRDQSAFPVFDTGLRDFNFSQMFSENRYSGYDRLNDAHQLTAAVTTRILHGESGAEQFKAMLGQRYYFSSQRVSLPNETVRPYDFSNTVGAISGLLAPKTYAEATAEYNNKLGFNERFSVGVRYQPDYGQVLSASYRQIRDPLSRKTTVDQIDLSGQWPLAAGWYAVGRYNYSLRDETMLEGIAGVEYNASCWASRLVFQRLSAIAGEPVDSVFVQLELNDFASFGANPLGLLRRSVPGYGKTNELSSESGFSNTP